MLAEELGQHFGMAVGARRRRARRRRRRGGLRRRQRCQQHREARPRRLPIVAIDPDFHVHAPRFPSFHGRTRPTFRARAQSAMRPDVTEDLFQLGSARGRRIVVAMSGGVDSSVVAALAAAIGAETIGVTLQQ